MRTLLLISIFFTLPFALAACDAEDGEEDDAGDTSATAGADAGAEGGDGGDGGTLFAVGDSVMEWNVDEGQSIPEVAAQRAGLGVVNAAISGAMVLDDGEEGIPRQYQSGDWSWVIVEGGANDIGPDGCGCGQCIAVVDQLMSSDGNSGALVDLLAQIEGDGNRAVLAGYYRVPDNAPEYTDCAEEMDELNARFQAYASTREDVIYVSMGDAMDPGDPSFYAEDLIHPSVKGSQAVGTLIGEAILAP